jgi:carboxyl-terminal processing protease
MLFAMRRGFLLLALLSGCHMPPRVGPPRILAALERCVDEHALARDRLEVFRAARPTDVPYDPDRLSLAANRWLATLGTSHTEFRTLREPRAFELADVFWEALGERERALAFGRGGPRLAGIGLILGMDASGPFVRAILDGSPAARAGVRVGERPVRFAGAPFEPVESFRGRAGLALPLELAAPDGSRRTLAVVPDEPWPRERWLRALRASATVSASGGRRLGYVHVWSWAGEEVQAALRELLFEGPLAAAEGLVLDLRDGLGGANPDAFALFSRELPTLTWSTPDGNSGTFAGSWTKPVVLLIDEHTTSGKEIFARTFQRAGRGPIVGTRSAGAVVGGSLFLLPGPSVLYLAVRDVLVDGERLEGRGVTPDVVVPWERESGGSDPQLARALEVLRAELGAN